MKQFLQEKIISSFFAFILNPYVILTFYRYLKILDSVNYQYVSIRIDIFDTTKSDKRVAIFMEWYNVMDRCYAL